jgi:hypothetical protein
MVTPMRNPLLLCAPPWRRRPWGMLRDPKDIVAAPEPFRYCVVCHGVELMGNRRWTHRAWPACPSGTWPGRWRRSGAAGAACTAATSTAWRCVPRPRC